MFRTIPEQVWTRWAPACGIVGVILFYAQFLYRHAFNIPFHDDIYDVVQFLVNVEHSTQLTQTVRAFFENYLEHRTLASRLVYYLAFMSEGEINFRTLVFLANVAPLLLLWTLYLAIRNHPRAWLILLPAALVLFQLRTYSLIFWSMSSFAYLFVYLYGFASILCLREAGVTRFLAAIVFATLGSFTLASGQLIWLVGLASLLQQSFILRRISSGYAVCWALFAVVVLLAWRIDYSAPGNLGVSLQDAVDVPLHHLSFFLTLLGNAVTASSLWLAASVGGVMLLIVGYSTVRNIAREDLTLQLFAGYIILSVAAITLGRAPYAVLDYALVSRYSFPSVLLLATLIVLCLSRLPDNAVTVKVYVAAVALAAVYWAHSFEAYASDLQGELEVRIKDFNRGKYWVLGKDIQETDAIVKEAILLGIYKPPPRPQPMPTVAPSPGHIEMPNYFRKIK